MANRSKLNHENSKKSRTGGKGLFRIIGGQWRGRKIHFIEVEGLRPSLDRVRETLFNWLQAEIHGAKALDLFAGSGAIGIEALSRGADWVQFVELNPKAAGQLANNLELLGTDKSSLTTGDAFRFVETNQQQFDLLFLDPPFHKGIAQKVIDQLAKADWLKADTLIYLEIEQGLEIELPESWKLLKDKKAGRLLYKLFKVVEGPQE